MSYNENLKVFAACYVAETEISTDNKLQLIDYIKNSSSKHIEHLLCTGYMKESLTEAEKLLELSNPWKEVLSDSVLSEISLDFAKAAATKMFDLGMAKGMAKGIAKGKDVGFTHGWEKGVSYGHATGHSTGFGSGQIAGLSKGLAATALVALAATISYKIYKRYLSDAAKKCKGSKGLVRDNCLTKARNEARKAKVVALHQGLIRCAKTKNPSKCKFKLQRKINIEKAKLGQL